MNNGGNSFRLLEGFVEHSDYHTSGKFEAKIILPRGGGASSGEKAKVRGGGGLGSPVKVRKAVARLQRV